MSKVTHINEQAVEEAFSLHAPAFDKLYNGDAIIQYKRKRVRDHVMKYLPAHSSILELNAGTGEDALYFAGQGHCVHATDISAAMLEQIKRKSGRPGSKINITTEQCSFNHLVNLQNKGPYDMVFSNFAGLNCTGHLDKVLLSFYPLLKPGGMITLVLLPQFCLWEFLLLFKGKFATASRRLFSSKGRKAHLEGKYFTCWYYDPSYIISRLKHSYSLLSLQGLCTIVPPSYLQGFAEKHPGIFTFLKQKEELVKERWPWNRIGDYYIITMKKKTG